MKKHTWSKRTVLRYTMLQLPALVVLILVLIVLRQWLQIPVWSIWTFTLLWIIKDIILFPFVWRAYDSAASAMIGARGTASEQLDPSGHVRIKGELWRARVSGDGQSIEKGRAILVMDIRGLTLIVGPGENSSDDKKH
jgi:membrane protein implicated in regulation of membrane protease activity